MNAFSPLMPAGRALLALDLLIFVWVCLWVGLGLEVAREIDGLKELSSTVRTTSGAVESAGRALGSLESLPLVGPELAETARRTEEAGASAAASARSSRESIEALSLLLGLAVAVIPSLSVGGFYLPLRIARRREGRSLRRLVERHGDDPELDRFLAARALQTMPLRSLTDGSSKPWHGDVSGLARAERRRLGVR